jgi:predicted dehydrogenase
MISENWVYSTMVQKAHAAIANGEIGAPFLVRSSLDLDVGQSFLERTWCRSQARTGGGALIDAGIHCVSACRYLLGEVREVTALTANHRFPEIAPMEDTAALLMRFESGATGVIACSYVAQRERPRSEFTIFGSKGTIEFDTHARSFFLAREKQRSEQVDLQASRGFVEQMTHFLTCLREGSTPITSPEEQIGSLKVVLAAYRSAATGAVVRTADV